MGRNTVKHSRRFRAPGYQRGQANDDQETRARRMVPEAERKGLGYVEYHGILLVRVGPGVWKPWEVADPAMIGK